MITSLYKTFITHRQGQPRQKGGRLGGRVVFLLWCVQGVVANQSAAQADVSNSFSIISSTSSGRYLWYFSGFLVKEMFAHLCRKLL